MCKPYGLELFGQQTKTLLLYNTVAVMEIWKGRSSNHYIKKQHALSAIFGIQTFTNSMDF
jgi:hypothetical protein